jgi:hypothetical protein
MTEPRILAFPDCTLCAGSGQVMGGDEYQQCPDCRLRARRNGAADALALMASELLDTEQAQSASGSELGWEKYDDLSPLEARYADGDR